MAALFTHIYDIILIILDISYKADQKLYLKLHVVYNNSFKQCGCLKTHRFHDVTHQHLPNIADSNWNTTGCTVLPVDRGT